MAKQKPETETAPTMTEYQAALSDVQFAVVKVAGPLILLEKHLTTLASLEASAADAARREAEARKKAGDLEAEVATLDSTREVAKRQAEAAEREAVEAVRRFSKLREDAQALHDETMAKLKADLGLAEAEARKEFEAVKGRLVAEITTLQTTLDSLRGQRAQLRASLED